MDTANVLIGAFLRGYANQLDTPFSQGHPVVLGQHRPINELSTPTRVAGAARSPSRSTTGSRITQYSAICCCCLPKIPSPP